MQEHRPLLKKICCAALLALLGLLGNNLALPVSFGVYFIFGSIFAILAVSQLGLWFGVVVALVVSLPTCFLWNHPYALIIFSAEILWMGLALRRGRSNLLLVDACYWLLVGAPLVFFFYGTIMGVGGQQTMVVLLKQGLNGVFNALAAWILLTVLPVDSWLGGVPRRRNRDYAQVIFQIVAAFLMVPSLGILLIMTQREVSSTQAEIASTITMEARMMSATITHWLGNYVNAVRVLAELEETHGLRPSAPLQEELGRIHRMFPYFHNVMLCTADGVAIGYDPPLTPEGRPTVGTNFSDRPWFGEMAASGQPVISDVIVGRSRLAVPLVSISVPVIREGGFSHFGLAAINLDRMRDVIKHVSDQGRMSCTIMDRNQRVIASTDSAVSALEPVATRQGGRLVPVTDMVDLWVPGVRKNINIMQAWGDAVYLATLPIEGTSWTMLVEHPVAPVQKYFFELTILGLSVVTLFFGGMLLLAMWISRLLTAPILSLAQVSKNLPARIAGHERIPWPQSGFTEVTELIDNFQQAAVTLDDNLAALNENSRQLEETVEARTRELRRERQRLDAIITGTNVGTWEWNVETGAVIFNERWAEIVGHTLDELQPVSIQTWLERAHPDDLGRSNALLARHFSGELAYYECECRMRHKDGHWVWVYARGRLVSRTPDNKPLLMSGTHADISVRKKAEEDLKESEARFRTMANSAPVLIWMTDPRCSSIWFNQVWLDFTGRSLAQEQGHGWRQGMHPADADLYDQTLRAAFEARQPFRLEYRLRRHDGVHRWLMDNGAPRFSEEGTFAGYIGSCIDITEQKELEGRLSRIMEEQRIILDNATVGILMVKERRNLWMSRKLLDIVGYQAEELVNASTRIFYADPEEYERLGREAYGMLSRGQVYHADHVMLRKDGSEFICSFSGKAIDPANPQAGSIWIFDDVTERKEAERRLQEKTQQLQALTRTLEQRVEEEVALRLRGEELLVQQSKLAAMGEMLGAISHQWRQPLNALAIIIQNIREAHTHGELDRDHLENSVRKAMHQIQHMSKTIDDFRNFFRPDKHKQPFNALHIVGNVLTIMTAQLAANRIESRLTCHTHQRTYQDIHEMLGCEAMISFGYQNEFQHVVLNIVNNAKDAIITHRQGREAAARISFDFYHTAATIVIEIADTGGGIEAASLDRIFEPYYTTKGPDQGTGLGLYMAKMIMEHMSGRLSVRNSEEGAVFVIELPAWHGEAAAAAGLGRAGH
jgi:PAS domain S-box-containing protein